MIVEEDHDIPNVAMYFFYKVGSRNERPGTTGISHFFEHMMFNGAKKYGPKQFDIEMEKAGGQQQRLHDQRRHGLHRLVPEHGARLMFDMEADRIRTWLSIRRSSRANAAWWIRSGSTRGQQQLRHASRTAERRGVHRASVSLAGGGLAVGHQALDDGGSEDSLPHGLRAEQLRDGGGRRCRRRRSVETRAKKYMEPIPRQEPPPPVRTKEPPQLGERRVTIVKRSELPFQFVSYHVPRCDSTKICPLWKCFRRS